MNTVHNMQDLINRKKGGPCPVCGHLHKPQDQCSREALAFKIQKLSEANALIPSILAANKEAVESAETFRHMLKKADEAHTLLMEVLSMHGEIGEQIKTQYMEKLDAWAAPKSTSPDTSDQPSLFGQEQSTSSETETKPSTKRQSGLVSEDGSSL